MTVNVREITSNQEVLNRCRTTVWKSELNKEPSDKFMQDIYFSEHSPIRDKWFVIEIRGVESFVATHFVRHHEGFTPYVSTCREDRHDSNTTPDRNTLVNMDITLNAQAFINVSRKRLCNTSHKRTIEVWKEVIKKLSVVDHVLAFQCVPNCIYRGGICPEGKSSCKYNRTDKFMNQLKEYIEGHENSYRE